MSERLDKLLREFKFDERWMALLMLILTIIVIVRPLGLPLTVGSHTIDFINTIKNLPEGGIIIWGQEMENAADYTAYKSGYKALISFVMERKPKLILFAFTGVAETAWVNLLQEYAKLEEVYGYKYGVDYVIFPYISGEEIAIAGIGENIRAAVATDIKGTPTGNIPLMKNVNSVKDADLVMFTHTTFTYVDMYVRQWLIKYGKQGLSIARGWTNVAPYYGTLITGFIDDSIGFAEFQYKTGYLADEILKLDASNLATLALFALIAYSMTRFYSARFMRREKI